MDFLGKLMPVRTEVWIRHGHLIQINENIIGQKVASVNLLKREPTSGRTCPETSHIRVHRGKTMTFYDVMEALSLKESKRRKWASDSRACSMEIKTAVVIHALMLIVGGKTSLFLIYKLFRLHLWLFKVMLWLSICMYLAVAFRLVCMGM